MRICVYGFFFSLGLQECARMTIPYDDIKIAHFSGALSLAQWVLDSEEVQLLAAQTIVLKPHRTFLRTEFRKIGASTSGASGASTPAASRGEASQRHHGAAASQTRSRTLPPRHGAASRTPPRPRAASRTPPPRPRAAASRRTPSPQPRARQRAATDRREQAAAEAPLRASTPKRVRGADRRDDPELHALVGPACETAEAHAARHPGFGHHQTCPRCRFYKIGPSWVGAYGTEPAPGHGPDSVQWLDERPSHWGGPGDWAASSALTQWQQFSSSRARAAVLRRPRSPVLGCPRIGSGEVEPRGRGSKFDAGRR